MTKTVSPEALAIIRTMQQNEMDESVIYRKIAAFAEGKENRRRLHLRREAHGAGRGQRPAGI